MCQNTENCTQIVYDCLKFIFSSLKNKKIVREEVFAAAVVKIRPLLNYVSFM